jgi:transcriptional antiterminator RfaH
MQGDADEKLSTQQVAERLGISTEELSELRLAGNGPVIEREGFRLYYRLEAVRAYEARQVAAVFERLMETEQPVAILRRMAQVSGLSKLRINGKAVQQTEAPDKPVHVTADAMKPKAQMPATPNSHPWYVVHTKPRQELIALENLERQGYSCYLPMFRAFKPRAGKLVDSKEPMFARYLFIAVDSSFEGKGMSPIRSTRGVHEFVRFGKEPAEIAVELLDAIRSREQEQQRNPERLFRAGDRVKVVSGPFAGLESIYQAQTAEQRSLILLELLSRPTKVNVPTAHLRKTG